NDVLIVSPAIRNSARGQTCTVRWHGCDYGTETTVFAHLPVGMKGVSTKTPDPFGVHACNNCHDCIDERNGRERPPASELLRALAETQMRLFESGVLGIVNEGIARGPRPVQRRSKGRTATSDKILKHP